MVLAFFHPWAAFLIWVKWQEMGSDHQTSVVLLFLHRIFFKDTEDFATSKNTLGFTSTCLCMCV